MFSSFVPSVERFAWENNSVMSRCAAFTTITLGNWAPIGFWKVNRLHMTIEIRRAFAGCAALETNCRVEQGNRMTDRYTKLALKKKKSHRLAPKGAFSEGVCVSSCSEVR